MMYFGKLALALVLGLLLVGLAATQPPGQPPEGPPGGFRPGRFGGIAPPGQILPLFLQDNLKLTDEQKKQLASLQKETDAALGKILTAEQKKQLKDVQQAFGRDPRGPGGRGPGGRGPGGRPFDPSTGPPGRRGDDRTSIPLVPKDDAEKKILDALTAARQGPRFANVPTVDGRWLRLLAETTGAKRVVEIGTSTGESGLWLAMALRTNGGHLYTHEIDPGRAKVAAANFKKAGVDQLITIVEGDAHETVKQYKEPIDIVFIDADKEGYVDYLEKMLPVVRPGGLIIAHNVNPGQGTRYVEAITKNAALETTFMTEGGGVSVTLKKR